MPIARPFVPPDVSSAPFQVAPDTVLDVPVPPGVNRTRKVYWRGHKKLEAWRRDAGKQLQANGQYKKAWRNISRYELTIIFDEKLCRQDPDNPAKACSDLLRSLEIITDDSPRQARKITIEWGTAPSGCRLIVKPLGDAA